MKFVPKTERTAWHEKALNAASGANLQARLELFTETKETERLADLVRGLSDEALEEVSHYTTDPAAKRLEKSHPGLAARLWRAQGMRIVNAKKSKYYNAALLKFRARQRLLSAGGTGDRMGANCALGLRITLPEDRLHRRISWLGCRLETQ